MSDRKRRKTKVETRPMVSKSRPTQRRNRPSAQEEIMKLPRRQFLHLAAGAAALPAISRDREGASLSDAPHHHDRADSLRAAFRMWSGELWPSG